jgi:hypothetical protein
MSPALAGIPVAIAVLPLGGYLFLLGWLHLQRRPIVVPGAIDLTLLAAGMSGLVAVGPLALLQPAVGTSPWATAMLVLVFVLIVGVAVLAMRPRLVIYNVTLDQLRPVVAEVVGCLDGSARWAGESVALPARGLQVLMDARGLTRCVSLVACGTRTSAEGWSEFSRRVRRGVRPLRVRRNPWGAVAVLLGTALLLGGTAWSIAPWVSAAAARLAGNDRCLVRVTWSTTAKPAVSRLPAACCSLPVACRSLSRCPFMSIFPPTRSPFPSS